MLEKRRKIPRRWRTFVQKLENEKLRLKRELEIKAAANSPIRHLFDGSPQNDENMPNYGTLS